MHLVPMHRSLAALGMTAFEFSNEIAEQDASSFLCQTSSGNAHLI